MNNAQRQRDRLAKVAEVRLRSSVWIDLKGSAANNIGRHLGLVAAAHTTGNGKPNDRAKWLIHWVIGYLREQGYLGVDLSNPDGRTAVEAIMPIAVQARVPHPKQVLNPYRMDPFWREVYIVAVRLVDELYTAISNS